MKAKAKKKENVALNILKSIAWISLSTIIIYAGKSTTGDTCKAAISGTKKIINTLLNR